MTEEDKGEMSGLDMGYSFLGLDLALGLEHSRLYLSPWRCVLQRCKVGKEVKKKA